MTPMGIQATPRGTHGARIPGSRLFWRLIKPLERLQIRSYRRSGSTRMSRGMDFPVVLLTTRGARSGQQRTTVLGGFADGDDAWLVVASKGGAATHPGWFFNMVRNPDDLWLEVGNRRLKVQGRSLQGAERLEALKRIATTSPRYAKYQQQTDREIPIVRLTAVS